MLIHLADLIIRAVEINLISAMVGLTLFVLFIRRK